MATSGIPSASTLSAAQANRESVQHILERLGVKVETLVSDSRKARPGTVFVAYPGEARDGRDFIPQAVAQRADGVLWEADRYQWDPALAVPNAGVAGLKARIRRNRRPRVRRAVARTAHRRRHRHQRQDARARTGSRRRSRSWGARLPSSAPSATVSPTRSRRRSHHARRDRTAAAPRALTCSRARPRARWRCLRTASCRDGSTAPGSTSRC